MILNDCGNPFFCGTDEESPEVFNTRAHALERLSSCDGVTNIKKMTAKIIPVILIYEIKT